MSSTFMEAINFFLLMKLLHSHSVSECQRAAGWWSGEDLSPNLHSFCCHALLALWRVIQQFSHNSDELSRPKLLPKLFTSS